jgi:CheY-like chemotaxis protein
LILLVEDEAALRTLLCENLRSSGYRVVSASNLDEAVKAVKANGTDISALVTDFVLRGGTGHQVAEAIRADLPCVEVVYMSGYTFDQIEEDELLRQAASFIQKPFAHDELLSLLSKLIGGMDACRTAFP